MRALDLEGGVIRYAGLQDVEWTGEALALRRLPRWTRAQIVDPGIELLAGMPTGARLEFDTDSKRIEVELGLTLIKLGAEPIVPAAVDLVVDGEVVAGQTSTEGLVIELDPVANTVEFVPGRPAVKLRFDKLGSGAKHVEVWLPHAASTTLRAVRLDRRAATAPTVHDGRRRWVHYGSSISHCLEADRPTGVWPVVAARNAGVALDSLALAGQAQLDQFAARTIRDLPADLISLKVGINLVNADSMRERTFVPAVHGFLDTIRDGHPTAPIVLITPILCPAHEDAPGPSVAGGPRIAAFDRPAELTPGALTIGRIRELLADVVAARQGVGDTNLHLLDGRDLFGEADLADLPDGLHPTAAGYRRMGERFGALAFAPGTPFAS
jgi:lysophospholipase L1-like esterase